MSFIKISNVMFLFNAVSLRKLRDNVIVSLAVLLIGLGGLKLSESDHDPQCICSRYQLPLSAITRSHSLQLRENPAIRILKAFVLRCRVYRQRKVAFICGKRGNEGDLRLFREVSRLLGCLSGWRVKSSGNGVFRGSFLFRGLVRHVAGKYLMGGISIFELRFIVCFELVMRHSLVIGFLEVHNFYLNEKRNLNFYGVPQLNWEKCYFMVKVGIVLGHKVSSAGLEVAKAKTEVITKLPPQTNVKGIRNTKGNLTNAPIMVSPEWSLPFELMCDASSFAVGAVLGQQLDELWEVEIDGNFPDETLMKN
ncbi:reverse transcriptase domain-containing protein [Tanacetum coccineum]